MFEMPAGVQLTDDLDVALNPEEYQDRTPPLPLQAGVYGVRIKKASLKKEYQKETLVLQKNDAGVPTYPVIVIHEIEVVTPEDSEQAGRRAFPQGFGQEFSTKPGQRKDFATGQMVPENKLSNIIRSSDASLGYSGLQEGLSLFQQLTAEGAIFHVETDWLARDGKWIGAEVKAIDEAEKAGTVTADEAKKARNEVRYKQGQQEGQRKFKNEAGGFDPMWVSPSGEEVEAKVTIRDFISTTQLNRYRLGAKKL